MSDATAIKAAYEKIVDWWRSLSLDDEASRLESFAIKFSHHSGRIENPEIAYRDVLSIFENGQVDNYSGSLLTLVEIGDMRNGWGWVLNHAGDIVPMTPGSLCKIQALLTYGTYDDDRWSRGERPGTFKRSQYTVGMTGAGTEPEDVEAEVASLAQEVDEAMNAPEARDRALTIAAYLSAKLVDIHPFSDGNGRLARLLMNWVLLSLNHPPICIYEEDKLAYFGAIDAFHDEGELKPLLAFLRVECVKTWQRE